MKTFIMIAIVVVGSALFAENDVTKTAEINELKDYIVTLEEQTLIVVSLNDSLSATNKKLAIANGALKYANVALAATNDSLKIANTSLVTQKVLETQSELKEAKTSILQNIKAAWEGSSITQSAINAWNKSDVTARTISTVKKLVSTDGTI